MFKLLSPFLRDKRASAVPMFSLAIVPLIGVAGAAVDYSRANAARTAMQAALDSTALMLSKEAQTLNSTQVTAKATGYFTALFNRPDTTNVQVTAQLSTLPDSMFNLTVAASGKVEATFAKLLGQSIVNIDASADVKWGIKKLEIALALDNTGSMSWNGKMTELKNAVHNLLNTLQQAAKKPGDIKVAIVPFNTKVKIGTSYASEPWLDFTVNGIEPAQWTGCVMDRDQSNDVLDTTPTTSDYHTLFPAANCTSPAAAMPLSEDWTALHSKVDAMTASGNTNVTIGMVWGWHALTANLPFTQAAEPAPDLDKVIILLTDGLNTQNRWTTSESSIDARTAAACANAKAANIKVYTVRVIEGDVTLLKNCATKPTMYYDVQQASELNIVFNSIAQGLANLRIAK